MRHSRFALFLLVIGFAAQPATARPLTVGQIRAYMAVHGVGETLNRFFEAEEPGHGGGYPLVEGGSPEGVALGVELIARNPGAVATEEHLVDSMGEAMMHNPRAVLPLLDSDKAGQNMLDAGHICAPSIGDNVSNARALAILVRTRRAIAAVHDPALQAARNACLADIAKDEANIRKQAAP